MVLLRSAFIFYAVAVVDEQLLPLGHRLEGPDASGVAEPRVVHEAELAVPVILEPVVDFVPHGSSVVGNAKRINDLYSLEGPWLWSSGQRSCLLL